MLSTRSATALYVGAVLGPGVLILPSLAAEAAGPASVLAWAGLLALSVPLAIAFAVLGVRHPEAGGTAAYASAAFGRRAGTVTGWWFLAGGVLAALLLVAVVSALPESRAEHWTPFAPHGWGAVGTAASLLMLSFIGWEAVSHLAGELRDPVRQLPRAIFAALGVVVVLYLGLAVATVGVLGTAEPSRVPLADLMAAGLGETARTVTAALAFAAVTAVLAFSGPYLLVPAAVLAVASALRLRTPTRRGREAATARC